MKPKYRGIQIVLVVFISMLAASSGIAPAANPIALLSDEATSNSPSPNVMAGEFYIHFPVITKNYPLSGTWEEVGQGSASGGGISNLPHLSQHPSIAIAPDGMPYAAWANTTNDDLEIYVQRWNGSSWEEVGAGSASGWGISNNTGASDSPAIAIAPDGTAYVTWREWKIADGHHEIYIRRWSGSGWEEVGLGSASDGGISNGGFLQGAPSIAVAPDGMPYVTWDDLRNGGQEIYVRRWNGVIWEEVGAGSASGGGISDSGQSRAASIAIAPDGTPYVAWQYGSSSVPEIYVRRWNGVIWEEVGASSASGGGISNNSASSRYPSIAIAPDGTPYVTWEDANSVDTEIYVRRWDGSSWAEVGLGSASGGGISDDVEPSGKPAIAIDPDGRPYITWSGPNGGLEDVFVRRWNGITWEEVGADSASGGGISNNAGQSKLASIDVAPDGTPYILWEDTSSVYREIYARHWNGSNWEEVGPGSATGGGISNLPNNSELPSITVAPDGMPYVAWQDGSSGGSEIYVRAWDGSSWEEVGARSASGGGISDDATSSISPSIAVDTDGTPYVTWTDSIVMFGQIYVRRWNGSIWEEVGPGSASGGGISNNLGLSEDPSIAIAPDRTPYIAWGDDSDGDFEIYVRRWNGSSWEEVGPGSASGGGISNNSASSKYPSIAIAPDGTPYVTWEDLNSVDTEIYVRRWDGSSWAEVGPGSASGGGISNNHDGSTQPSIAIAPDGTPYVTWSDTSGGSNQEIHIRRWSGSTWEEVGAGSASGGGISDNNNEISWRPVIAFAPDGWPYVTWHDGNSEGIEIYVLHWNGGNWLEVGSSSASNEGISNNDGFSWGPSIAVAPNGTPYITWWDDSDGDTEIYVRRWIADH